jgi:uncharacterized integral membrane protein (TIGR00698 family)
MKRGVYAVLKNVLFGNQNILVLLPGVAVAVLVMLAGAVVAGAIGKAMGWKESLLSPILVAIIIGLVVRNVVALPAGLEPGIKFGLSKLLRLGIILMGIRLSILSVLKIGAAAVGMVFVCIVAGLAITAFVAKKLGISEKLATLVAAGTSICGVSAILASAPTIEAEEEEIAYAVGTITVFGMLATMMYPYMTESVLHLSPAAAGFFLGTSVHDTSQVTASALIYDQLWTHRTATGLTGADIAITTKLVRNTFMVFVIPILGYLFARKSARQGSAKGLQIAKYIPLFVLGYILVVLLRSLGDYTFGTASASWTSACGVVKTSATYLIAIAVSCIGLNTNIRRLAKLGYKPFVCGLIAAVSVGAVSWLLVTSLGSHLRF